MTTCPRGKKRRGCTILASNGTSVRRAPPVAGRYYMTRPNICSDPRNSGLCIDNTTSPCSKETPVVKPPKTFSRPRTATRLYTPDLWVCLPLPPLRLGFPNGVRFMILHTVSRHILTHLLAWPAASGPALIAWKSALSALGNAAPSSPPASCPASLQYLLSGKQGIRVSKVA